MPYMQKFMREYGNKIEQIFENVQIKKTIKSENLKTAEATIKQSADDSTNEDTMKTIKSNF